MFQDQEPAVVEKVLHLIDSAGMYGAENVVITLLEQLKDSAFPGILGCIRETDTEVPEVARVALEHGLSVEYFTMKRGLNPAGISRLLRHINAMKYRLVHSHGYKTNIYLEANPFRKFRVITTIHGWAKQTADFKQKIYEMVDRISLKRKDAVVAVSQAVAKDMEQRGVKPESITLIYNGIQLATNKKGDDRGVTRQRFGLDANDFVVGTVGRLDRIKGQRYLIESLVTVLKTIPDCKVVIAGEGPLRQKLTDLSEKLGIADKVRFLGFIDDVDCVLAMLDIFVLPSLSEGLPISLLEAMAQGVPIVATQVGGIPEVITHNKDGILIPSENAGELATAIQLLHSNPDLYSSLSASGKEIVTTKFSAPVMAGQYVELYTKLLQSVS